MKKCLGLSVGIAAFLIFAGMDLSFYAIANAVEVELDTGEIIELDDSVVQKCSEEGLNLGACACVVSIMLEETGTTSLSLEQMIQLATDYPEDFGEAKGHCKSVN